MAFKANRYWPQASFCINYLFVYYPLGYIHLGIDPKMAELWANKNRYAHIWAYAANYIVFNL